MYHRSLQMLICSFVISIIFGVSSSCPALAQGPRPVNQQPAVKQHARVDAYGDPVPAGALARMGTLRDFIWDASSRIVFSADGRFVTASSMFIRFPLRLWAPASGRVVREFKELDRVGMGAGYVAISQDGTRIAAAGWR